MGAELARLDAQLQRSFEGEAWHGPSVLEALKDVTPQVAYAIRGFRPERLDEPFTPGARYTAYTQFIGITQHNLYHAGQIVLLKKAGHEGRGLPSEAP